MSYELEGLGCTGNPNCKGCKCGANGLGDLVAPGTATAGSTGPTLAELQSWATNIAGTAASELGKGVPWQTRQCPAGAVANPFASSGCIQIVPPGTFANPGPGSKTPPQMTNGPTWNIPPAQQEPSKAPWVGLALGSVLALAGLYLLVKA